MNNEDETIIASNLINSIRGNDLFLRNISSVDKILSIYFSKNNPNINDEKQIINFVFQYLDIYGKDALILFRYFKNSNEKRNIIKRFKKDFQDQYTNEMIDSFLFTQSTNTSKMPKDLQQYSYLLIPLSIILILIFLIRNYKLKTKLTLYEIQLSELNRENRQLQTKILFLEQKTLNQIETNSDKITVSNNHSKSFGKEFFVLILSFIEMIILMIIDLPHSFYFVYDSLTLGEYVFYFFFTSYNFFYLLLITVLFVTKMTLLFKSFISVARNIEDVKWFVLAIGIIALFNYLYYID